MEPDREGAFLELLELHTKVNDEVRRLAERHRSRLKCGRGCCECCIDELTVFEVEAERIRREFPFVLVEVPNPEGACAFLDAEGTCRVYAARPFVCRTQGLPLLWFDEDEEEEIAEHRQICELNLEGEPLATLDFDELWVLGPNEQRLSRLQEHYSGGGQERIALRELFGENAR